MNLLKKLWKNENGGENLPVRRGKDSRELSRGHRIEELWDELDRDPFTLVRNPWSLMDRMQSLMGDASPMWPAVDVNENDKEVAIRMDVPGVDAKDLEVEVSGQVLTVRGSRNEEHEDKRRHRRERVNGEFVRSVTLPAYVDPAALIARYEKGVLTVTVPRLPGQGPKRIEVTGN